VRREKPGRTKIFELATVISRIRACTTGTFTPGIASGSELKSERSIRCQGKWVRNVRRRLIMRGMMYSGMERFGAKGWLYIERTEGNLRMDGRGGGCQRRRRRLRKEVMSGSVTRV
jgi:hypothetical protein